MKSEEIDIIELINETGEALMTALKYETCSADSIKKLIEQIDRIIETPEMVNKIGEYFRSSGSEFILYNISNTVFNLKAKGSLSLTPENIKWLGSVWKNFLKRNISYQEFFPIINEYRQKFEVYYPGGGTFVNQISNVHQVKNDYIDNVKDSETKLQNLERFNQITSDLLAWMKPTYYFILDYYYERRLATGEDKAEATILEKDGLQGFGQKDYKYLDILVLSCQTLGVLEAIYLIMKKKKTSRKLISLDGKQQFLTVSEIYNFYLEKFVQTKKDLTSFHK